MGNRPDERLSRTRAYTILPEDTCIIGRAFVQPGTGERLFDDGPRDTAHREGEHPQWEDRALTSPDEGIVNAMLLLGATETITVMKEVVHDDGKQDYVVVSGRRRVIAAREVNRRIREDPKKYAHLPGELRLTMSIRSGDVVHGMLVGTASNEFRKPVPVLRKAQRAKLMLDWGADPKDVATALGVSVQTVTGDYMDLLSASEEMLAAVRRGEESAARAIKQGRSKKKKDQKPRPKQSTAPKRAQLRRIVESPQSYEMLDRYIGGLDDFDDADPTKIVLEVLRWVAGEGQLEELPKLKQVLDQLAAPKPKQKKGEPAEEQPTDATA